MTVITIGLTGRVTIQPAAALVDTQIGVTQTYTNSSTNNGALVRGNALNLTVSNSGGQSTSYGQTIRIDDNASLNNTSIGLTVTTTGTSTNGVRIWCSNRYR